MPLRWTEQHTGYGRHVAFTYSVRQLVIEHDRWRATVSIHNDTNLRIVTHRNFALLATSARSSGRPSLVLAATEFSPRLPRVLDILETWTGTCGGRGAPPKGTTLRLRFGTLSVLIAPNLRLTHVTRHALRW